MKKYKNIEQFKNDINLIEKEESSINEKLFLLSVWGAVFLPCGFLIVSLFFSLYGLISYPTNPEGCFVISSFLISIGLGIIFLTVRTIGWASSIIPLPKFQISFEDYQKEVKMKANEKRKLSVGLDNNGDLLAEKVRLLMFFPPEFKVSRGIGYRLTTQSRKNEEHPNYQTVIIDIEEAHIGICLITDIFVEAPSEPDIYTIPVSIYEKNVPETHLELTINVTE